MKITVKLLSIAGSPPSGFDEFGVRAMDMVAGSTVVELLAGLSLPSEEAYTTIINGEIVPPKDRADTKLADGDEITLFAAIQGG